MAETKARELFACWQFYHAMMSNEAVTYNIESDESQKIESSANDSSVAASSVSAGDTALDSIDPPNAAQDESEEVIDEDEVVFSAEDEEHLIENDPSDDETSSDEDSEALETPFGVQGTLAQRLSAIIQPVVEQCGLQLFDVEAPGRSGGVLRVYVWKGSNSYKVSGSAKPGKGKFGASADEENSAGGDRGGVVLDECAKVSKALELLPELDEAIEGAYILEVSSPGITRKLSRFEHFSSAIGELVKFTMLDGSVIVGTLSEVTGSENATLHFVVRERPKAASDKKGRPISKRAIAAAATHRFASTEVKRARVEFEF